MIEENKIIKVFKPKDELKRLTKKELLDVISDGFIDYFKASQLICKKLGGRLPTLDELGKIASSLYSGNPSIGAKQDMSGLTYISGTASSLGLPEPTFYLWSGEEGSSSTAYGRGFFPTYSGWGNRYRGTSGLQAVCLGD